MPATTDLCDANELKLADGTLRVLAPNFHRYGKHTMFAGRVKTLKVFEDSSLVRTAVESAGEGRVLVEGINLVRKHLRKSPEHPKGTIVSVEAPLPACKLRLYQPERGTGSAPAS